MYAMTGMTTKLNLMASNVGDFPGRSANYSGVGFAQMQFTARSVEPTDYDAWVARARASGTPLTEEIYHSLAKPSDAGPVRYYSKVVMTFADIVASYMSDVRPSLPSRPTDVMKDMPTAPNP